ncbi:hypothetical protein GCM10009839_93710 [Catenulispora yoronensis]|uniref:DUF1579 domain-containing protein n=1 Tax=Catenulispora yoronensis TaxID=450799 RepID=A0ABP5H7C3_9ACTN
MADKDFDFFHGRWRMRTRKLRDVFDPTCTEWVELDGVTEVRPAFGGAGNVETTTLGTEPPLQAVTVRLHDAEQDLWRVWYVSTRAPGYMGPADEGRFEDGRGVFICEEELGGRPGLVRHQWTALDTGRPRWEQAFSFDKGQTWETNYVSEHEPLED